MVTTTQRKFLLALTMVFLTACLVSLSTKPTNLQSWNGFLYDVRKDTLINDHEERNSVMPQVRNESSTVINDTDISSAVSEGDKQRCISDSHIHCRGGTNRENLCQVGYVS